MYLSEIFFGWQGEGLHAGAPQVFVRTAGCPIRCAYCDTPESLVAIPACTVRPGGEHDARGARTVPNPVTIHWAFEQVLTLAERAGGVHSVSITGGEPLAQEAWVAQLAERIRTAGLRTYLETAGILPERFARVARLFDVVAADVKIPSATGERARWETHAAFLAHADPARTFVKAVVSARTTDDEVDRAAQVVAARSSAIPLFLQPVTPVPGSEAPPPLAHLRRWAGIAGRRLDRVHVAPQWHLRKGKDFPQSLVP